MMEIIATTKYVQQISPDDFDTELRHKICDTETTLGEILDWYENIFKSYLQKERPCVQLAVTLSETDESYSLRKNK